MNGYFTELLGADGRRIVRNPDCKKCFGRGWSCRMEEKYFAKLQQAENKLKELGKIPKDWAMGQYYQCRSCLKFIQKHELELMLEKANAEMLMGKSVNAEREGENTSESGVPPAVS